jgi:hypothetical protein
MRGTVCVGLRRDRATHILGDNVYPDVPRTWLKPYAIRDTSTIF